MAKHSKAEIAELEQHLRTQEANLAYLGPKALFEDVRNMFAWLLFEDAR